MQTTYGIEVPSSRRVNQLIPASTFVKNGSLVDVGQAVIKTKRLTISFTGRRERW